MKYKDKKRKVGSQSEVPSFKIIGEEVIVSGYQRFSIFKNKKVVFKQKVNKFEKIKSVLSGLYSDVSSKSITDIGCSSGLVSFIANSLGYNKIQALDHDAEYVNIVDSVCGNLDIININTSIKQFGDDFEKTDVVLMLALIHWIFSCTSEYGSFDLIFEEIKEKVGDYLLIEWVDPKDGAIKFFNHTSYNKEVIKEEYNVENFEKSILKNFSSIEDRIKLDGEYRVLYIIKK